MAIVGDAACALQSGPARTMTVLIPMRQSQMNRPLSILSVGTHPKDAIIYCGGTLAKHVARSDKVCCLAVTHGARWTHWRAIDEMAESGEPPDIGALI